MAQFLARVASRAGVSLDTRDAASPTSPSCRRRRRDAINALAERRRRPGRTQTTYDPLARCAATRWPRSSPACRRWCAQRFPSGEDYFTDDQGGIHEDNTNRIARPASCRAWPTGVYGPDRPISRQQMAGFLTRYLDGQVAAGEVPGRTSATTA
jgi:hypothetical protein